MFFLSSRIYNEEFFLRFRILPSVAFYFISSSFSFSLIPLTCFFSQGTCYWELLVDVAPQQAKIEDFIFFAKDYIFFAKDYVFFSKDYVFFTKDYVLFAMDYIFFSKDYPASAGSARARRACALRVLGQLLADGTPTGGRGENFLSRQPDFFYGNSCNSGTESRKIVSKVGN